MTEQTKDNETTDDEMKALSAEVDVAVDGVVAAAKAEREAETDDTDRKDQGDSSDDGKDTESKDDKIVPDESDDSTDESETDDSEKDAVADEHLERAVKAGLTMAEARQFGSASLLDTIVSRLEAGKKDASDDGKPADESAESTDDDPLAAIPDLDPEVYDENVIKGFAVLKAFAISQQKTIKDLQSGQVATSGDWLDSQVAGLDKAVSTAITSDPAKMEEVRDKLSVLEAGYNAAGKTVPRKTVFQEAVRITMGDVIAQSAVDAKVGKLEKRSKQHITRPAGHRASPKGDPLEEIAAELDEKYFKKT